jgi:hypothetical protein
VTRTERLDLLRANLTPALLDELLLLADALAEAGKACAAAGGR